MSSPSIILGRRENNHSPNTTNAHKMMPETPLENVDDLDHLDFIRTIAVARIMMPKSHVRLSAGREKMSDEMQAMTFFAGANSIFYGECLLTTPNPETHRDIQLFRKLGINMEQKISDSDETRASS